MVVQGMRDRTCLIAGTARGMGRIAAYQQSRLAVGLPT